MNFFELRNALKGLGYQLSNAALSSVVLRYHNKKGTISFDTFIQIVVRVIVMFDTFQKNSTDSRSPKKATFTLDQVNRDTPNLHYFDRPLWPPLPSRPQFPHPPPRPERIKTLLNQWRRLINLVPIIL
ncbi:calpain-A-like isoform X1 [Actinia tenebrosa]|uniref:Calpain-A-like isoform X1 n=1 Tax=Actinia tenebrosa TaxID=6105 RepID=A0A6P8H6P5_ACTTE|nr:calpain-A-like isoform X1 [Actinia tenebrosa]XP_031552069.1 calpain-A-like isoform X1 [Actinia tenebrosa]